MRWSMISFHGRSLTYVLGAAEGDTGDARDVLQAELGNGLASLLLVARVDGDGSAGGNAGITGLGLGVADLLNVLGDLVIGKLFNTGIGHCEYVGESKGFKGDGLVICWCGCAGWEAWWVRGGRAGV